MSYTISTDIFCDVKECSNWIHGGTDGKANKKHANEVAAKEGWIRKGKNHICDICAKKPIIYVKQFKGRGMGI